MTSVCVETYGCALNQSESEELIHQLDGYRLVDSASEAHVVVLNTCMVIEATERKILKRIELLYAQRRRHQLIVSGCMVQQLGDRLSSLFPELLVLQNERVAPYILTHFSHEPDMTPTLNITARVKIAHGCQGSCSYCVVKLIKGPIKSRSVEVIAKDVEHRIQHGAKQIYLTAQDGGAYGLDCGLRLPELLEVLCELKYDFKLRIGMMNVASIVDIVEDLVQVFTHPKVYKFLHLPVQSGSDTVLQRMERGYTVSDFKRIIARFRRAYREITLSTDFIVGFPTETADDFQATMRLIRETLPLKVNITRFSKREGTAACISEPVVGRIAKERSRTLTAEHHRIAYEQNCLSFGKSYRALAVERGKNESTVLYNDYFRPIVVPQKLTLGVRYELLVTEATPTYLIGTLS
ncbi:MAG: tRNA (N(6)-L-threonylcarbamoyladenosine(37)-C(2))-methylthiotransferase [Halobacteriota archaeon]